MDAVTYQLSLSRNRYAMAALSVSGLTQPRLSQLADYLYVRDVERQAEKGRPLSDDHLRQLAKEWTR